MKQEYLKNYKHLGFNISYYRKLKGLSQEQLAELIDISRTHMSRIETADCAVSLDIIFAICEALSVSPDPLVSLAHYSHSVVLLCETEPITPHFICHRQHIGVIAFDKGGFRNVRL